MLLLQPLFLLIAFVLVRAGDLSIQYGTATPPQYIRCILYAILAIAALVVFIVALRVGG